MKLVAKKFWIPKIDCHFNSSYYQLDQQTAGYDAVKTKRIAIDVGAHVGLWSRQMCERFEHTIAFEPCADLFECLLLNAPGIEAYQIGLGAAAGSAKVVIDEPTNTGARHLEPDGPIEIRTLDSFAFDNVDFIKLDVQGMEREVIDGAAATLDKWQPVLVVENAHYGLSDYIIERFGYHEHIRVGKDMVLVHERAIIVP